MQTGHPSPQFQETPRKINHVKVAVTAMKGCSISERSGTQRDEETGKICNRMTSEKGRGRGIMDNRVVDGRPLYPTEDYVATVQ
jgi:hypothetical protein